MRATSGAIEQVDFHRTKYGPEILVDAAWVREMPTFIQHGPHALTFYDILLVTSGTGWFWLDAHRYAVKPNTVLVTTPGQVRQWQVRDLDGLCLFFPALFLEEFFQDPLFLQRLPFFHALDGGASVALSPSAASQFRRRLMAMRRELRAVRPDSSHLLRARLYETLISLAREYSALHGLETARVPHPVVSRYRQLVERDATRRHHVADYARELGVSAGHLNELCKRHLGRGAKEAIQDRLAVEARRALLYSDETAARVSYLLGFKDPSYFTRFFRRVTGRSPTAFRNAMR